MGYLDRLLAIGRSDPGQVLLPTSDDWLGFTPLTHRSWRAISAFISRRSERSNAFLIRPCLKRLHRRPALQSCLAGVPRASTSSPNWRRTYLIPF